MFEHPILLGLTITIVFWLMGFISVFFGKCWELFMVLTAISGVITVIIAIWTGPWMN